MGLKTHEGKVLLRVEHLTNWDVPETQRAFDKWIQMANQCALDVEIIIEPEFREKEKDVKED